MFYVYFLKSLKSNKFYIGCSADLEKRIQQHNIGKTKSTRPYRPWKLIYSEVYNDKKSAFKREWRLKHPKGYLEKIKIIKNIHHNSAI